MTPQSGPLAPLLRVGDHGNAVRDLRQRLAATGAVLATDDDAYDEATREAVRRFQERRGLRVDGVCGPETWGALIESGFRLGDRLLYLAGDMLRGDDVADLQQRLNTLGFDAAREDGILGPETEAALRNFQRNAGITPDGVCGPATLRALAMVGALADGSVAAVRERDGLRRDARRLDGLRVFLAADPGVGALAPAIARDLGNLGAVVGLDTSGDDAHILATEANRFRAGIVVALNAGIEPGIRCAYFATDKFRSEGGYCLALRLTESLRASCKDVEDPVGRTYRILRETRMAAVVCELGSRDDASATSALNARLPEITAAIVSGLRRGVEEPV